MLWYEGEYSRGWRICSDKQNLCCLSCGFGNYLMSMPIRTNQVRRKQIQLFCRPPDGRISSISVGMTTFKFQVHEWLVCRTCFTMASLDMLCVGACVCVLLHGWHYLQSRSFTCSWCLTLQSTAMLQWLWPVLGDIDCSAPHRWAPHNADEWTPAPAKSN